MTDTELIAKIADLQRKHPGVSVQQIASALNCGKTALYRRAENNQTVSQVLNRTADSLSNSIDDSRLHNCTNSSKSRRIASAKSAQQSHE
jgi:hypothetical protein